ncbi:hypothetical protein B9Q04_18665 [Candidatus Marsarchaeota G2 archaeon BE_D]|jgi:hypothetical protein|uniref:Uncharacterized protein n=1 Tax=Candidatus Marsarchaeota G2 archaeon BE_D TaxID=1978158 RepID=A0A2R6C4E1_9ARCH|nr:MAG: hypothetical protein B9Q04_18665 [Candidatus Marsarchaeota G2 archaeon BE_D]
MFETRGRSSPGRWPVWEGCELCGHNLKLHDEKGRCPVCRENARRSGRWSPCYEVVFFRLPARLDEFLEQTAAKFRVTLEDLALIVLEADYYCDHVLGLPASETDLMVGEAVVRGDMPALKAVMREVTEGEKRRITQSFALLLERDGFFGKIVEKHRIPAPNYIAVFHHILLVKARYLPGLVEALERRVESLDQD